MPIVDIITQSDADFSRGFIYRTALSLAVIGAANNGGGNVRISVLSTAGSGLANGSVVTIEDVFGTVEANGTWVINAVTGTTFVLVGSVFVNAWVSGGTITTPIDLTGTSMHMSVRRKAADVTVELKLTTVDGSIVYVNSIAGQFQLTISQEKLLQLEPGTYEHSLIMTSGVTQTRIWSGVLTHSAGPSRDET